MTPARRASSELFNFRGGTSRRWLSSREKKKVGGEGGKVKDRREKISRGEDRDSRDRTLRSSQVQDGILRFEHWEKRYRVNGEFFCDDEFFLRLTNACGCDTSYILATQCDAFRSKITGAASKSLYRIATLSFNRGEFVVQLLKSADLLRFKRIASMYYFECWIIYLSNCFSFSTLMFFASFQIQKLDNRLLCRIIDWKESNQNGYIKCKILLRGKCACK